MGKSSNKDWAGNQLGLPTGSLNMEEKNAEKTKRYLKYAMGEIALVMIGILLALQVNNWNENRKKIEQERFILEKLKVDLNSDINLISYQIEKGNKFIDQYKFCVDVLLGEKQSTYEEFVYNLSSILTIIAFDQNRTTFDNIVTSGRIEFLRNPVLTDAIIKYFNSQSILWDTSLRDYTRNIIAPFMLKFDHIPQPPQTSYRQSATTQFTNIEVSKSKVSYRTIEDYQKEVFILNILRNKIYTLEGQLMEYKNLRVFMYELLRMIDAELG
jgi:hypothetical protein